MVGKSFLTHLEGCFILETSSFVICGSFCFYFGKSWNWKNWLFKIDSNQSPSYNMLKMTIASFHGFVKHQFRLGIYGSKLGFPIFPCFVFLLVKAWILLKSIPYQIPYHIPYWIPYQIPIQFNTIAKPYFFVSKLNFRFPNPSSRNWSLVEGMEDVPPIYAL